MESGSEKIYKLRESIMKILFVDDESKKLKRLYSAISQIEGINQGDLESALDLKSAKEKFKDK